MSDDVDGVRVDSDFSFLCVDKVPAQMDVGGQGQVEHRCCWLMLLSSVLMYFGTETCL